MALGIAVTMFVYAVVLSGAVALAGSPPDALTERLRLLARCEGVVFLWPLAMVANIARTRFFSPEDIAGSGASEETERVRHQRAVLQNTIEQSVLAWGAHFGLAVLLPGPKVILLPCLAGLFSLGRLTFWLGERRGASARAFGFAVTFYPTVAAYACLVVHF